jgi:hypothetical protein
MIGHNSSLNASFEDSWQFLWRHLLLILTSLIMANIFNKLSSYSYSFSFKPMAARVKTRLLFELFKRS